MVQFKWQMVGLSAVAMGLGGWLLSLGIGVLQRRRWGARMITSWSIAKMLFVLAQGGFNLRMQQFQFEALMEQPGAEAPFDPMILGTTIGAITMVLGVVWGWALPVFLLIWFHRAAIRSEVAQW